MRACLVAACACTVLFAGCHKPEVALTQLQVRQMQTRSYDVRDQRKAVKAILNVLQDEAFIPQDVNLELGFVHAVRELDIEDGSERFWAKFWYGRADATWKKHSIIECAANVTELSQGMRVRINFQLKVLNNKGEVLSVEPIADPRFYQDFFARVDKSMFLEQEGV